MPDNPPVPSYQALIEHGTQRLYDNSDSPRIDAEVLLQHVLDKPLAWLLAWGDRQASAEHIKRYYDLIGQRVAGRPIAYLTGSKEFWSLNLIVNEAVLIPRADTETLVDAALELLHGSTVSGSPDILDLGTGSGAIALALAKELADASVVASDAHKSALQVAEQNAERNLISNVRFVHSDWFSALEGQQFDLIVSNPPYLHAADPHLEQGDLRFEPDSALISPGNELQDLTTIITDARKFLRRPGLLLLEHGSEQADPVAEILSTCGYQDIRLHRDLHQLPRVTSARLIT